MSGFSLSDGTSVFSFNPEYGYKQENEQDARITRSKTGKAYIYKFFENAQWKIPLYYVTDADAITLNDWWSNNTALSLSADILLSVSTVFISNKKLPINSLIAPYDDLYKGTIELDEM